MEKNVLISELSIEEAMILCGGEPTLDTSFAYDVAWCITKAVMWVGDLFD
jgi:hypothetical protein